MHLVPPKCFLRPAGRVFDTQLCVLPSDVKAAGKHVFTAIERIRCYSTMVINIFPTEYYVELLRTTKLTKT